MLKKSIHFMPVLGLALSVASVALAGGDNGPSNGGDVDRDRSNKLREYILGSGQGQLKADLQAYFRNIRTALVPAPLPEVRGMIATMIDGDVLEDIAGSNYVVSEECVDSTNVSRSATTLHGVRKAEVCFSLRKLSQLAATRNELIGLAAHEHSRHFGLDDQDHDLATYVTSTAEASINAGTLIEEATGESIDLKHALVHRIATMSAANPEVVDAGARSECKRQVSGYKPWLDLYAGKLGLAPGDVTVKYRVYNVSERSCPGLGGACVDFHSTVCEAVLSSRFPERVFFKEFSGSKGGMKKSDEFDGDLEGKTGCDRFAKSLSQSRKYPIAVEAGLVNTLWLGPIKRYTCEVQGVELVNF